MSSPNDAESSHVLATTHPCRLRLFAPEKRAGAIAPPELWFAILTYNALAYTKRCLLSLDLHTSEPWHAVILDNGSTDGTRDWLAALDDPRITVELGTENRGVAGGRNRLVQLIGGRVPDSGYMVFIDNDLEMFPGWLTPFRELFARHPEAGIASASGFEIIVHDTHRELLSPPAFVPMLVDVASGGFACFVRPAVFRAIGEYDERLNPFWHEDDDITVRARAAGWDAYTVPNTAVIHHGHKSGAAVPAMAYRGSRDKQAYLVDKWRALGLVRADGRLRYGNASDHDAMGISLARRLHRAEPLSRSEHTRARVDIAHLVQASTEPGGIAARSRFASAPALALLTELMEVDPGNTTWPPLRDAVQSTLDTRRRQSRLGVRQSAPTSISKIADAADWDDGHWLSCASRYADDGRGRLQWYDRSAAVWEATQAAVALERLGLLRPDTRILIAGDLRQPLPWNVAAEVQSVVIADFLEQYGIPAGTEWINDLERFALNPMAVSRTRAVAVDALASALASIDADAIVLLPWSGRMSITEHASWLQMLAPHLKRGAPVLTTIGVRLAGPPDARVLESTARLPQWLASIGLESVEPPDTAISDVGLLAATEPDVMNRIPDLLIADGQRLSGRLFIAARVTS